MAFAPIFAVFVVSHVVGDFILQTEHQARHKRGGLTGPPESARALLSHVLSYALAFLPALVWLYPRLGAGVLVVAAAIAVPHLLQDDGRALRWWMRGVKRADPDDRWLFVAVDQSFHVVALLGASLLAASA